MERTIITTLTPDDLRQLMVETFQHCLKNQQPAPDNVPSESGQLISKKSAARLWDCSTGTVDNAARAGKLTRHYVGRSVRFDRAQVLALAGWRN